MDLLELHRRGLRYLGDRVRGVPGDSWGRPTPCAEWDVRDLVHHNVYENLWAGELGRGRTIEDVGDELEGDLLGGDPVGAYERSAEVAASAFADEAALERDVHVSYGPVSGAGFLEHRCLDLFVHGWDLAAATGQDGAMPDDAAAFLLALVEEQEAMVRGSGVFGDRVEVPADASDRDRLLGLLGRDPTGW